MISKLLETITGKDDLERVSEIKTMDVDIVDLNYCSKQSWELTIRQPRS